MPNCKEFRLNITQLFNKFWITFLKNNFLRNLRRIKAEFEVQRKKLNLPFGKNEYGLVIKYLDEGNVQLWIYSDTVTNPHSPQLLATESCRKFNQRLQKFTAHDRV